MSIGKRLKELREAKGWSLRHLERVSGVSNSMISQIENEKKENPTIDTLSRLAEALGVSPGMLFADDELWKTLKEALDLEVKPSLTKTDRLRKHRAIVHLLYRARHLRESQQRDIEEVARDADITPDLLANYESGADEPDLNTIQRLAHALNTSMAYLLGETDDPSPPPQMAAHREGAEYGAPLPPEAQLIIERTVRSVLKELDERERKRGKPND